jgi:hypothetical protein
MTAVLLAHASLSVLEIVVGVCSVVAIAAAAWPTPAPPAEAPAETLRRRDLRRLREELAELPETRHPMDA